MGPDLSLLIKEMNFLLLVFLLYFLLKKPVKEFFASRAALIRIKADEAASAHREADRRLESIKQKLGGLQNESEELMKNFENQGRLEQERIIREAKTYAARITADTRRIVDSEMKKAREELKATTVALARNLAEKMIKEDLRDNKEDDRLSESFLRRFKMLH